MAKAGAGATIGDVVRGAPRDETSGAELAHAPEPPIWRLGNGKSLGGGPVIRDVSPAGSSEPPQAAGSSLRRHVNRIVKDHLPLDPPLTSLPSPLPAHTLSDARRRPTIDDRPGRHDGQPGC